MEWGKHTFYYYTILLPCFVQLLFTATDISCFDVIFTGMQQKEKVLVLFGEEMDSISTLFLQFLFVYLF